MTLGQAFEGLNDGVIKRVDFDMWEVVGQSRFNPFVEDGDVVIVNAKVLVGWAVLEPLKDQGLQLRAGR